VYMGICVLCMCVEGGARYLSVGIYFIHNIGIERRCIIRQT